jgi:deoxycytidylate deaminase
MSEYKLLDEVVAFAKANSDDTTTQVGACIVVNGQKVFGTNRFYSIPEGETLKSLNADKSKKYAHITHAEVDCINNAGDCRGGTLYVNYVCCDKCADAILQAGIIKVVAIDHMDELDLVARWNKYWIIGRATLKANGIPLEEVK